jgi:hypothetical protein
LSASRYIKAKLFDFTANGTLIIYGMQDEHLIVELGVDQIRNLDHCLSKYIDYYKIKEEPCA